MMENTAVEFLREQRKQVGSGLNWAILLGSVGGILIIAQAWLLAQVVNAVILEGATVDDVRAWLVGLLVLIILRVGVVYFSERAAFSASSGIKQALRQKLLDRLRQLGPVALSGQRSGEISTIVTDSVEALEDYYARYLPAMSLAVWIPLSILAFILPIDWKAALIFFVTAPLIPVFMVFIGKGTEKLNQAQWKKLTRMGGYFLDVVQGLTTLKLFNASRAEAQVIGEISDSYRQATMKVLRVAFLSSLALEFLATVSIALVAVTIGFRLLFAEMDFLAGFFILLLAPEFYLPLRSMGTHYHARMQAIAASERIIEIMEMPSSAHSMARDRRFEADRIALKFDNIQFSYADRPALNGVTLDIEAGQRTALVGSSGSGKSTLVNLILGFIEPQQGQIRVNGVDLSSVDLNSWRQHISWVPQRPHLFSATLRDNLCLGKPECVDEDIWNALDQAQAADFVQALPSGLDTAVGDGGQGLSGGQKQRLVLARAFLRDSPLVLLDEPTAHLDLESERLVQQALDKLCDNRTVLVVAHRLSTIQQADKVIVLDQGQVAEQGSHGFLMGQPGLYRAMWSDSGLQIV